jgi:hypothetical protein
MMWRWIVTILFVLSTALFLAKTPHAPQAGNGGLRQATRVSWMPEALLSSCAFAARVVAGRLELAAKKVGPKPTFLFREWRFATR